MKKSILKFGKKLSKEQQKNVHGGTRYKCSVNFGDPRCCAPSECGDTGGVWYPGHWGYGVSENCICF